MVIITQKNIFLGEEVNLKLSIQLDEIEKMAEVQET